MAARATAGSNNGGQGNNGQGNGGQNNGKAEATTAGLRSDKADTYRNRNQ